jgi:hypothetical protein
MPEYTADSVSSTPSLARGISVSPSITTTEPHQAQPAAPIACHRCGAIDTPTLGPGSGPHCASARCRHCGHFIRWLSTRSPAERQARRQQARLQAMAQRPPSPLQLAYLAALGDSGPPPATMVEASSRIDAALQRGEGINDPR